jgi:glucose/arabinose dehydrogenase
VYRSVVVGGDAGLLDLALDPAFANNRLIYITYTERRDTGNGVALSTAASRLTVA